MAEPDSGPPEGPATTDGFRGYPTGHVYGIVDNPVVDVPAVMAELLALDLAPDSIHVYCCRQGVTELSPSGRGHGLKARVQRLVQQLGYEGEHLRKIERELNDGHALIGVAAEEATTKRPVAELLHRHGGHDVHFYGRFTLEDL